MNNNKKLTNITIYILLIIFICLQGILYAEDPPQGYDAHKPISSVQEVVQFEWKKIAQMPNLFFRPPQNDDCFLHAEQICASIAENIGIRFSKTDLVHLANMDLIASLQDKEFGIFYQSMHQAFSLTAPSENPFAYVHMWRVIYEYNAGEFRNHLLHDQDFIEFVKILRDEKQGYGYSIFQDINTFYIWHTLFYKLRFYRDEFKTQIKDTHNGTLFQLIRSTFPGEKAITPFAFIELFGIFQGDRNVLNFTGFTALQDPQKREKIVRVYALVKNMIQVLACVPCLSFEDIKEMVSYAIDSGGYYRTADTCTFLETNRDQIKEMCRFLEREYGKKISASYFYKLDSTIQEDFALYRRMNFGSEAKEGTYRFDELKAIQTFLASLEDNRKPYWSEVLQIVEHWQEMKKLLDPAYQKTYRQERADIDAILTLQTKQSITQAEIKAFMQWPYYKKCLLWEKQRPGFLDTLLNATSKKYSFFQHTSEKEWQVIEQLIEKYSYLSVSQWINVDSGKREQLLNSESFKCWYDMLISDFGVSQNMEFSQENLEQMNRVDMAYLSQMRDKIKKSLLPQIFLKAALSGDDVIECCASLTHGFGKSVEEIEQRLAFLDTFSIGQTAQPFFATLTSKKVTKCFLALLDRESSESLVHFFTLVPDALQEDNIAYIAGLHAKGISLSAMHAFLLQYPGLYKESSPLVFDQQLKDALYCVQALVDQERKEAFLQFVSLVHADYEMHDVSPRKMLLLFSILKNKGIVFSSVSKEVKKIYETLINALWPTQKMNSALAGEILRWCFEAIGKKTISEISSSLGQFTEFIQHMRRTYQVSDSMINVMTWETLFLDEYMQAALRDPHVINAINTIFPQKQEEILHILSSMGYGKEQTLQLLQSLATIPHISLVFDALQAIGIDVRMFLRGGVFSYTPNVWRKDLMYFVESPENRAILQDPSFCAFYRTLKESRELTIYNSDTQSQEESILVGLKHIHMLYKRLGAQQAALITCREFQVFLKQICRDYHIEKCTADILVHMVALFQEYPLYRQTIASLKLLSGKKSFSGTDAYLLFAIAKDPKLQILYKDRERLLREIALLKQQEYTYIMHEGVMKPWRFRVNRSQYRLNTIAYVTENSDYRMLDTLTLMRIYLVLNTMTCERARSEWGNMVYYDINELKPEVIGYLPWEQDIFSQKMRLGIHLFDNNNNEETSAGHNESYSFTPGICQFHGHNVTTNCKEYSGPSGQDTGIGVIKEIIDPGGKYLSRDEELHGGDTSTARRYNMVSLVQTACGLCSDRTDIPLAPFQESMSNELIVINLDLYYWDDNNNLVVLDLGNYIVPYRKRADPSHHR